MSTRRFEQRSSGRLFLEWLSKLVSEACWSSDTALFHHVRFLILLACKTRTDIICTDLANPLFACTGMSFWLYMSTVILSLPKSIVLVALGAPSSEQSKGVKVAKVLAIGFLVIVTSKFALSIATILIFLTFLVSLCQYMDP